MHSSRSEGEKQRAPSAEEAQAAAPAAPAAPAQAQGARATYTRGRDERSREAAAFEQRSRSLGLTRLIVAFGAIALVGAIVWAPLPSMAWAGEGLLVAIFAVLVVVHARVVQKKDGATAALRFYQRGLARISDGAPSAPPAAGQDVPEWRSFPQTGERFRSVDHPFSDDLDLFGRASLFQLIDATETRYGEERLAAILSSTAPTKTFPEDVRERQEAVKDLAGRTAFRERISALGALLGDDVDGTTGAAQKPDPRPFLEWAGGTSARVSPLVVWGARLSPLVVLGLFAASSSTNHLRSYAIAALVLQVVASRFVRADIAKTAAIVSSRETGLSRYGALFANLEAEAFKAPLLRALQARLLASGASATREMGSLSRIVSFLDARNNEVFRFLIGPVLLWDLNCVLSLEAWRARAGGSLRAWFEVLGEIEALSSLGGFAFERPDHAWPELTSEPVFEAHALGHPLLPKGKRVDNDIALGGPGHGIIVTGSNMSGKSTLLRAMGVNSALALAGAPVCAQALRIGPLRVVTSMRVRDSLEEGVSHFYAELKKLKRVLDLAGGTSRAAPDGGQPEADSPAVLFLLDEILHGTNSRERILGARAILRELLTRGATGAVSTHDLGISDLESELPEKIKNVHFEEQVEGDRMTFDYRLRSGIVQSSNALRLMKLVGIDVAVEES